MAQVNGTLSDPNSGTVFFGRAASDTHRTGSITVTGQTTAASGVQYRMVGTHFARYSIQDFNIGGLYIDYWGFQPVWNGEEYRYIYMPFYGPGPRRNSPTSTLRLGKTYSFFDLDLPPRATATGISFSPRQIPRGSGETELRVEIATTRATLESTRITVEIQVESNPNQIPLEISSWEDIVTVGPNESGQVIVATFGIRTPANNTLAGDVRFRATITEARNPSGVAIQIGNNGQGSTVASTESTSLQVR